MADSSATEPGDVEDRGGVHVEHHHLALVTHELERVHGLLGRAEEERPGDLVEQHAAGQLGCRPGARRRRSASSEISAMRRMNSSAASTTPTVTATTMSKTTVSDEAGEQHHDVAPRRDAQDVHEVAHLGHVPGHDEEQRRQRRHRQVATSGASAHHRQQHEQRSGSPRRAASARRRGCWSRCGPAPGGGDAAEERGDDVADAERQQLGVGVVLGAGHAVGDHGREQRLDGARAWRWRTPTGASVRMSGEVESASGAPSGAGQAPGQRQRRQRRDAGHRTPSTAYEKREPMVATWKPGTQCARRRGDQRRPHRAR